MTEEPPQISILDARLAEIDRRLRTIQTGLVDAATKPQAATEPLATAEPAANVVSLPPRVEVPEPGQAPASASPEAGADAGVDADADAGVEVEVEAEPPDLVAELRVLAAVHERLLESMRELVTAYERALCRLGPAAAADLREFSVSAGPFPSTEALRGFERTLSQIPEVREVAVRGYEGDDRAIVDVRLFDPTS